jgi:RHS repeat-associated protein
MGGTRFGSARLAEARMGGPRRLPTGVLAVRGLGCLVALLVAILVLAPASALAEPVCTDTWTGPAEGNWTTAEDWSTGKVPTSADVACIGAGKTVNVTAGANQTGVVQGEGTLAISGGSLEVASVLEVSSIATLSATGGTLKDSGELDVTHSFVGGNGKLEGTGGMTVIKSGASGSVTGSELTIIKGTLVNEGSLTVQYPKGAIEGREGARIVNSGTLTINGEGEGNGLFSQPGGATLKNTGTVQKTEGTGKTWIRWEVDNEKTITATKGQLYFYGGGVSGKESTGSWSAGSGAEILFGAGTYSLGSTVPLSGTVKVITATVSAGKVEAPAASLSIEVEGCCSVGTMEIAGPAASTVQNLSLKGTALTTLSGSGEVDVTGSFVVSQGRMKGSGSTVIKPGASGLIETGPGLTMANRTLVNEGSLAVQYPAGGIGGGEGARIVNSGTFTINGEGEGQGLFAESGGATLTNTGAVQKTEGTGTTRIGWAFENFGTIHANTGKFLITNPIVTEASTQYGGGENPSVLGHPESKCGDPVSCATGNFSETQTDFAVGGRGVGLKLARTYNSQAGAESTKGVFGYGWTSSFSDHLVVNKTSKVATLYQANGSTVPFVEGTGGSFTAPAWTQDTLSGTEAGGYTLTLASQVKDKFAGASGRLESVTDRDGNATTLTYNGSSQLTTITDPTSHTIKLAYNGEGLVESAEDPMKHVVKYTYEGGNLKNVTQPAEAGLRWQFKYDGSHEMTELTDGRGGKTVNEYNASHQVIKQTDPAGREMSFEYEAFHTKITNKTTGSVTDEHFTSNDEPFSITRGFGTTSATMESFAYNTGGYVTSVTDGDEHTTKYGYSGANDRTSMVDPNNNETKWTYNSTHDVETMTTPKGETTTIKREAHGNPETIERPAPESKTQITKYKYKTTGELESVEDPLKRITKYEYGTHGNRTVEIDPATDKRTWEYNEDSQETATVSPRGNVTGGEPSKFTTKIERDAQGRPLKITDPLTHTTKYTYDGDGNVKTVIDGNSHTTTYTYNADNQPIKVEAPNKAITETEYDGAGQVTSQTDGNKNTTKYKRNPVEEVTEVTDPLARVTKKTYDAAGNLKTLEDPAKRTTTYKYDPANRLTEVSYSSGKPATVTYEYDKDGDRTKMVDGTGTTKYTYDQLDRLTESENGHADKSKYEYDLANEQTKITYPNTKSVTRAFDAAGRLEKVTDWSANVTKFTYNADSEQATTLFPSTTKDEDKYAYNEADQMTEAKMLKETELASLVYTRDNDGQVKKTTSKGLPGSEITENTYDENNRLTKSGSEYKYDSANNPTTIGAGTYKYDKASELETGPSLTYTFDELGERTKTKPTTGPATTYGYDQAGNLTSVERPKEGEVSEIKNTYAYNGEGLRASQTISGATSYPVWDVSGSLPLLLNGGSNNFVYGPGGLPVEIISSTGTVTYVHHDQAGSTRLLTGSTGTVEGAYTYDAYGNTTGHTGTATTSLEYDGQYTNGDGLIYMRARAYDPATVQFLSVDPLVGFTLARYNYVEDNPLNGSDPSGLCGLGSLGDFGDCFDPTSSGNVAYQGAEALNKVTDGEVNLPWLVTRPAFVDAMALLGCAVPASDAACPALLAAAWSDSSSSVIAKGIETSWCNPGQLSAEETVNSLLLSFGGLSKFAAGAAAKQGANALAKTLIRGGPVVTQGLLDAAHN